MKRLKAAFEYQDRRGVLTEIARSTRWKQINFMSLKKGFTRGGHYHKKTRELFFIVEGRCAVKVVNAKNGRAKRLTAKEKDIFVVEPYEIHYVKALKNAKMITLLSIPHNQVHPDIHKASDLGIKR